jgi:hypothetical protein
MGALDTFPGLKAPEKKEEPKMPWWQILLIVLACIFGLGGAAWALSRK